MFITEWWNSLGFAAQIFYCLAVPSTLLLLIQTVMMFIGFGEDGADDIDTDIELDADGADLDASDSVFDDDMIPHAEDISGLDGLRIFTIRGIVAFFVVFGWVGVAMDSMGIDLLITIPVAFVCGFAMMVALAYLFKAVLKLRSDGNTDNRNAIGTSGKVHLTIPPARSGEGKVHIMLQGSYVERGAVTDDTHPIATGSEVVVVGTSGQTDLVVRRK